MGIDLRTMTPEEFDVFYRWSMENHILELMEEENLSRDAAIREAAEELTQMLPQGLATPHQQLLTIEDADGGAVGFLWTLREETEGRRQSFLCDFSIWEQCRRKGYATAALALMEQRAVAAGCEESVLFVADRNTPATALYEKCGYRLLRRSSYGAFMIKRLEREEKWI